MQPEHVLLRRLQFQHLQCRRHTGATAWRELKIKDCGTRWRGSRRLSTLGRSGKDGRSGNGDTDGDLIAARFARIGKRRQSNLWVMVGRIPLRLTMTCVLSISSVS